MGGKVDQGVGRAAMYRSVAGTAPSSSRTATNSACGVTGSPFVL
jgi:hypothetical protein